MGEALVNMEDIPMFGMLRNILADEEKESCKMLLFVVSDEQIIAAIDTVKKVINFY